jgi:hypothetical protein
LHGDKSEQALAHEAESVELIAAFLATQNMVEYVSPTTEWVAAEVDMDAQEQLQRILTAATFELIQRSYNYFIGHHGTLDKLSRQGIASTLKECVEFCPCCHKMSRIIGDLSVWRTIGYRYYRTVAKSRLRKRIRYRYCRHVFQIRQVDVSEVNDRIGHCKTTNSTSAHSHARASLIRIAERNS